MNIARRKRSGRFDRKRAIVRRFVVLAVYRFFSIFVVGIMPLTAHALVSMQTETASNRTWVTPECWLLSLVMWEAAFAEASSHEKGGIRRYVFLWWGLFGTIVSAYAYGSLIVLNPAAHMVNEVFQRYPVHAIITAMFVLAWLNYPVILAQAVDDADKGHST